MNKYRFSSLFSYL